MASQRPTRPNKKFSLKKGIGFASVRGNPLYAFVIQVVVEVADSCRPTENQATPSSE